jgi:hypothetical protein
MKTKILSQPQPELVEFKRPASNPEPEPRCSGFLRIPVFGISRVLGAAVLVMVLGQAGPASAQRLVSPEVQSDGRVSFRLKAPEAKAVLVHCEGVKASEMQKDGQGVWSLTTEPLEPDIYAYSFAVDGVHCIDPANPLLKTPHHHRRSR